MIFACKMKRKENVQNVFNFFIKCRFLKEKVKAPFVGPKSKKFPKGLEVRKDRLTHAVPGTNHDIDNPISRLECSPVPVEVRRNGTLLA